jgi:hypothetical protein
MPPSVESSARTNVDREQTVLAPTSAWRGLLANTGGGLWDYFPNSQVHGADRTDCVSSGPEAGHRRDDLPYFLINLDSSSRALIERHVCEAIGRGRSAFTLQLHGEGLVSRVADS